MMRWVRIAILALSGCAGAVAQQVTPHAAYVYPAGGQRGTTFEAQIGGQFLNNVTGVRVSGEGVHVSVVEATKPINAEEARKMRDQFRELVKKWAETHPGPYANSAFQARRASETPDAQWSDQDEQQARLLRTRLRQYELRRTNPSLAEIVRLKISISPNASLGQHELRLETSLGLTAPLNFFVDTLPEWTKPAADSFTNEAFSREDLQRLVNNTVSNPPPTPVVNVTLPVLINGQIMPGGVDSYRFHAHRGEHLVAAASARQITPYIADGVPGWFQASLTLYDAKGKEIRYIDHYSFHPDPVLLVEIPEDGDYTIALHDSIYRGREDFVYRLALGDLPFVTGMFPLGGKAGAKTKVELMGWNLSETKLTEHPRDKTPGVVMVAPAEAEFSERPFAFDTLPEAQAKNNNHTPHSAQSISVPVIVNGRVNSQGEAEYFQFKGKAGQSIEAEVYARRLGSPLDSVLTLTDASGKTLAANDDFADESEGLLTDQADSLIRYQLPSDGTYFLCLRDTLQNGGPEYAYRLRVREPEPDFDVRIAPSSINIRPGATVPLTVVAVRRGGFDGDIVFKLKDAQQQFLLGGGLLPAGQTRIQMTLSAAPSFNARSTTRIALDGFAKIRGKDVRHASVPSEYETQAFFYHHMVTTSDLLVTVEGARQMQPWLLRMDHPLTLIAGRAVPVRINLPSRTAGKVKIALSDAPEGITLERTVTDPDGSLTVYLKADGAKAQAGLRSNLLFTVNYDRPAGAAPKGRPATVSELMPAFPFEVLAASPRSGAGSASVPAALPTNTHPPHNEGAQ